MLYQKYNTIILLIIPLKITLFIQHLSCNDETQSAKQRLDKWIHDEWIIKLWIAVKIKDTISDSGATCVIQHNPDHSQRVDHFIYSVQNSIRFSCTFCFPFCSVSKSSLRENCSNEINWISKVSFPSSWKRILKINQIIKSLRSNNYVSMTLPWLHPSHISGQHSDFLTDDGI